MQSNSDPNIGLNKEKSRGEGAVGVRNLKLPESRS